jgi:tetratricopeptide (TPR) repeat protein
MHTKPAHAGSSLLRCTLAALALMSFVSAGIHAQTSSPGFDAIAESAAAAKDSNDIPRAIQLYIQAEQLRPEWASGWWSLGLLQYSTKDWSGAREAFTHYIDIGGGNNETKAQAIALRAQCEMQTGDFSLSLADLERALALNATDDSDSTKLLRLRQAQVLTRLGRFEESLQVFGLLDRGGLLPSDNQTDRQWDLSAGLAGLRNPQLPAEVPGGQQELYVVAGNAALQFMRGDETGAAKAFSALFQRFPDAPNAHYLYGFLVLPTDPDATVAEYHRELEVAPTNETAAAMLAWVLLSQRNPAEALPFALRAVAEAPTAPVAQLVLGRSLAETGDLTDGIEHLETALRLQPGFLETHVALATAYSSAGREEDARRERLQSLAMAEAHVAQR